MLDTIALKLAIGLYKLVVVIFAVSFEIIIQWAVGNQPCYLIKTHLIMTVLYNRSRKNDTFPVLKNFFHFSRKDH
jgi:hypothetical protein